MNIHSKCHTEKRGWRYILREDVKEEETEERTRYEQENEGEASDAVAGQ
jgi:hypothetical protein